MNWSSWSRKICKRLWSSGICDDTAGSEDSSVQIKSAAIVFYHLSLRAYRSSVSGLVVEREIYTSDERRERQRERVESAVFSAVTTERRRVGL